MRFVPLSELEEKPKTFTFVPLEPIQSEPILSPEELMMGSIGAPNTEPPPKPRKPSNVPEMRAYEPSIADQFLNLFPGDRAKSANEANARRIAREQGISVDEAYRQMKEAVGVRGPMGARPSGQPMFNPEGRAPIKAAVEATPYVFEGIKKAPAGAAEATLRAIRGGAIEDSIDQGFLDQIITNMADDKDNLPFDPNYQGFQGLGKSLGFSLASMVSSAVAGTAATVATGGNVPIGIGAGMAASGTMAYRASKDDFLNRLRDKLNKDSERLYGTKLTTEQWQAARDEFDAEAVKYGAWEAVPEALSNAIFLKAFAKPAFTAGSKKLQGLMDKAGALAVENITETATGYGQNAAEFRAGLTKDEISIVDAFKQQFIQTGVMMGVMGGGMKGKQLAEKFYNDQVLPRVNPGSALAKAIKADIDAVAYSPEAIRQEAVRRLRPDQAQYEMQGLEPVPSVRPATITPPEEEPTVAPPAVTPPVAGATNLTFVPLSEAPKPGGRVEPSLSEAPITLAPEPRGRVEPPLGEESLPPVPPAITPSKVEAVPGMMTDEDLAQPENLTITPVTVTEPEVTPAAPAEPTLAAASLPETPTVPPAQTPKLFEPTPAEHQAQDMSVVALPVKNLTLSKDVPQFKAGASDKGVVEPLSGKFTQEGVAPIAVWRRLDGSMEVISGRHRLDLAKRTGTELINAQVYDEASGFDKAKAAILDAELNIRDEQGKVKDYVNYFKASGTDRETADAKGFLARTKGKRGFTIADQGSDALVAAINSDQIGDEAAYYVAINAPKDERLQNVGLRAIMDGKSMNTAVNTMQAVKAMAAEQDTTTDMFGFDDSLIKEAQEMAKIASKMQQSIQTRLAAITGAAKNPAMAKAEGIDVRDPDAIKRRIEELRAQKAALENWSTSPELVAEIRAARGVEAPQLELRGETEAEIRVREATQDADRQAQEARDIADRERDFFQLQPQVAEREEAPTMDMFAGEAAPSAEYQAASELANRAGAQFRKVQEAYRSQEIGDDDFLAGRKVYDAAMAAFDKAVKKEQGVVEPVEDTQERIISMTRKEYREDKETLGKSNHPSLSIELEGKEPKSLISRHGEKNVRFLGRLYGFTTKDIKGIAKKLIEQANNIQLVKKYSTDALKSMTKAELAPILKQLDLSGYGQKWQLVEKITRYTPDIVQAFNRRLQDAKHQTAVTNALRQGKDVRDEVLKDYPELVPFVRERGSDMYNSAISQMALKETSNLTGMNWTEHADSLREDVKDEQDPKTKQVWNDIADEIDRRYEQTFAKRADIANKLATATAPTMESMIAEQKRIKEEAAAEAVTPAAELTTSEREAEIKKINAGIKRLALEQIKLPVEDEVREAEIDKEMSVLIDRLKELQGKPKQARPAVVEKAPVFSETELTDMQNELVKLQQRKSVMIGDTSFVDNEIEDIKDALRDAGIDPREFAIEANEAQGEDIVNDEQAPDNLPSNQRLLLMPCSDMKGPAKATAMELYKGVFFQTYKSNVQPGAFPLVVILSAKHGFINTNQEIAPYDEVMSTARADTMLANLPKYIANIKIPSGITDVMIVGGKEYQRVMRAAVAELQSFGLVSPEASINATSGGIGVQRQQLGEYLRAMQPTVPVITQEPFTIDVEAKVIDENVKRLPAPDVQKLEKHYGVKRGTDDFVQMVKDDIVRFANEGAEAVAKAIREIIRKLHAGVLSAAMIFNPVNISSPEFLFHPSQTYREDKQVLAEVPEDVLPRMSPSARQAYKVLYPSIKDRLIKNDKLMVIADKPAARVFVFKPDGSLLLDRKVLYGSTIGDFYKGNTDLPQNRITPAGLFTLGLRDATRSAGEARTAGEYDFKKVFVLDKAIGGEYSVTLMHSVWLNESDAQARAKALLTPDAADSRYSFGCINVDKPTYSFLINNHLQQMDGASLFVVPDDPANLAAMLAGKENVGDELNRTTFKTPTVEIKKTGQLPSAKAREATQLAAGERRKKPSDFLFNLERGELRKEQIKEYATMRAALARVPKQVAAGKADLSMQAAVTRLMQQARDLSAMIKVTKPRLDSAEQFLAKAAIEFDKGNISEDVFNVIKTAYDKMPELLGGLLLSVRAPTGSRRGRAAGQFLPFTRVVRLFKGTSGVTDPVTIRHELTHSLEQMMTTEQRAVVAQAWLKGLQAAIKKNPDEKHQKYFHAVMDFIDRPTEANNSKARDLLPSYDMYQFINPSEFWAVNAENLMAAELGNAWGKFKRAIARLWEGLKNVFGFDNRYVVQKMFKDVMNGSKERLSKEMLIDLVGSAGVQFDTFENIEDDKKLLEKYNRPNTPQLDQSPLKTQAVNAGKLSKDFFTYAVSDPLEALGTAANSVDRAILYARNKNVWFGSGLNAADFSKYNGDLLTSQGLATASVALDNAIRGGQIATEVIFQGGIKFDSKSRNFVAVKRDKGMRGVYEAEGALKKRLGDQLGTDIIQGYLEAKRSRSIQNEYFDREVEYEFFKSNYEELLSSGAPQEDIMAARDAMAEAKEGLAAIEVVYKKIRMSDEEIDDFTARDAVHPELRKIMDNWSAINQNMLALWRQVGLMSEKRYENLSNIKDYVPWQRIMNDATDIHSPVQASNRKMTNIGLEKLFKKGKPTVITDFVAKDGQQDFKIQPAVEVEVEINGSPVDPDKVTMTADGQVKLDVPVTAGDLVVFRASREIENIIDNMTRNVMRMTMNGLRHAAAQRIVMEYATRDKKGKIMVFPKADKSKGRFDFIVNGERVVVEIQDPLIAESIFGMESLDIAMLDALAMAANFTRRTITLSGVFQIKQVFKDAPTAALVTGVKRPLVLIGGVYKGFVTSLLNTDPTVKILKAAGIGGFQSLARTPEAEIKRRLGIMNRNVFDFVIKGLDHIGDASDMAQRVAVYKRVLAETGNETQALYQAANVINFLHHGSGQVSQAIVKTVPFAGAYANSMDVLIQALAGGGLKGRSRANALARLAATGTLLAGITLLYCFLVGDDEDYNQMDDQTKLRNFMIPGTKILLPMNTSAAYFYKAVPEMIYNKVVKEGTKNAVDERRLRTALKEAAIDMLLGPTPVPSAVKPFIELGLNKDFFTGRPVVPEALAKLEAAERYTAETSEAGKFLSSLTGTKDKRLLDPIETDHLIRGIFGTAGAMVQWFTNSIAVASGERAALTDKQQPITGSFLRADVGRRNEDLFYDFKAEVDKRYGTFAKMLEREDEAAAEAYEEKHSDIIDFYKDVNKMESELKEINAEIRYYGESKDTGLNPQERREEIKLLQLEKQELLEDIIEMRKEAGL